tara:strand:- start:10624 stop:11253 length:630 start_codon:yes stop_codon:yes gene_type:complete
MNRFKKYSGVFVAECDEQYKKGELIIVTTKYDKQIEVEIFNKVGAKAELFYYSVIRTASENYAQRKANKYLLYSENAEKRSDNSLKASKEGADFLALAEPIKIGHHSESRHRNLIERNDNRMRKSIAESDKAEDYKQKAEYWENKSKEIDLSMPESFEYYIIKLEEAKNFHKGLKDGSIEKEHSYSITYANKKVKDLTKKVKIAELLWK